jgi:GT2 family glycosyltransferase
LANGLEIGPSSEWSLKALSTRSKLPLVSVIIQNYNGLDYLKNWLGSVLNLNYPNFEIIVVDDASTDGSVEYVEHLRLADSRLNLIRSSRRLGIAEGRNVGIRAAKGKFLFFLDNDVEVDSNCLDDLVMTLECDESIGAAQSKVLFLERRGIINSAGGFVDLCGDVRLRGLLKDDNGDYDQISEISFASGCALFASRKALLEIGLFDPRFVFWYDDVDACLRIRLRGYRIVYVPQSRVYHLSGGSRPTRHGSSNIYFDMRNRILMLVSNLEAATLLKNCLKIGQRIVKRYGAFLSTRGVMYIIANFKEVWKERERVQLSVRRVPDAALGLL